MKAPSVARGLALFLLGLLLSSCPPILDARACASHVHLVLDALLLHFAARARARASHVHLVLDALLLHFAARARARA